MWSCTRFQPEAKFGDRNLQCVRTRKHFIVYLESERSEIYNLFTYLGHSISLSVRKNGYKLPDIVAEYIKS